MKKQFRKRYILVGVCLGAIVIALNITAEDEPRKTVSVEPQLWQAKMLDTAAPVQHNFFSAKEIH